ncbi:unnamed protein product [Pseudo-nitzschia multistriata]|uniref:Major facilitator superfamily (MFS) profile domain-containing protein n=1 Tax=Pseudo-nitzschia multistriata TaxID=183589 RepID=A0A448ZBM3_9STRA|nr:unnamed protein product [Pseudo-nitzschia multistriata]
MLAYLTLDTSTKNDDETNWQLFVILCSIPCFASTILGMVLVPESPRWLLEQCSDRPEDESGSEKALKILKDAARKNGISQNVIDEGLFPPTSRLVISWDDVASIEKVLSPIQAGNGDNKSYPTSETPVQSSAGAGDISTLFSTPSQTRLTLLLWATWFGNGFLYYGVIIAVSIAFTNERIEEQDDFYVVNDDTGGNGNDDTNSSMSTSYSFDFAAIFITASSEIFGLVAVLSTVDRFGRIPSQTMSYRIGGIATFVMGLYGAIAFAANDNQYHRSLLISLAFVARMAMMGGSCTTWVSTSEILTTDIRTTGHGTANAMGRLGGFTCPYFITEGNSLALIGVFVLFISVVTAECAKRLPETAGKAMGDIKIESTIESPVSKDNVDCQQRAATTYYRDLS